MSSQTTSTLLTRLELAGVIRAKGPDYGSIRFAPKSDSRALLSHYEAPQAAFLEKVFTCCQKAKNGSPSTWSKPSPPPGKAGV